eukprot:TRINITY_DN8877_c0_g1_i1.p1 TRINITY_DN8877_c0_g1~~TRINITY_DN8877_c0_g1_i1.p1  ORF type:complete len:667 (-),score=141.23 TRINITY_DN8877_c0_g1_i1:199-2199(-)
MVVMSPPPARIGTRLPDICGQRAHSHLHEGGTEDPLVRCHSKLYQRRREIEEELRRELNLDDNGRPTLLQHGIVSGRLGHQPFGRPPPVPKPRNRRQRLPTIPKLAEAESVPQRRWGSLSSVGAPHQRDGGSGLEVCGDSEFVPAAPSSAEDGLQSVGNAVAAAAAIAAARAAARPCPSVSPMPTTSIQNGGGSHPASRVPSAPPGAASLQHRNNSPSVTPPSSGKLRPQSLQHMRDEVSENHEVVHGGRELGHRSSAEDDNSTPKQIPRSEASRNEGCASKESDEREPTWRLKAKELEEIARQHRRRNEARRREAAQKEREESEATAEQASEEERQKKRNAAEARVRAQQNLEKLRLEQIQLEEERRREQEAADAARRQSEQEEWEKGMRKRFEYEERVRREAQQDELQREELRERQMCEEALRDQEQREQQRRQQKERDERQRERWRAERRVQQEQRSKECAEEARRPCKYFSGREQQPSDDDECEQRAPREWRSHAHEPPAQPPPPRSAFRAAGPGSWGQGGSPSPRRPAPPPPQGSCFPSPPGGASAGARPRGCGMPQPRCDASWGRAGRHGCSVGRGCPPAAPIATVPPVEAHPRDPFVHAKAAASRQIQALKELTCKDARQKGFKDLLRAWHPDKNPQNVEVSTAVFQMIQVERKSILNS